ncbi:MAG: homoserine O-acetyltransferase, partial [Parvibaculum sp.]|nr:homoserine O-acetyltransferase [Parvibaculum sp.]
MNTIEKAAGPSGAAGPDSAEFEEGGIRVHRASMTFGPEQPLALDSGVNLSPFTIAYETYGT